MSRTFTSLEGASARGERIGRAVALLAGRACAKLSLWRNRVRYRRALARMSERELTDIGVGWSTIAEEVSKPFWRA